MLKACSEITFLYLKVKMIFFVDDVADHLEIYNAAVVVLEGDQELMNVIRWLEENRFEISQFDVIGLLIGRADLSRSRQWFNASLEEMLAVITARNASALILVGAFVASNA